MLKRAWNYFKPKFSFLINDENVELNNGLVRVHLSTFVHESLIFLNGNFYVFG